MDNESALDRARTLVNQGKKKQARNILREIAKRDPNNEEVYILFAQAAEKREHAIYSLQRALKINPNNRDAQNLLTGLLTTSRTKRPKLLYIGVIGFLATISVVLIAKHFLLSPYISKEDTQPDILDVSIYFALEWDDATHPIIVGYTNLPDGTIIMTSVRGVTTDFSGQDKVVVTYGVFQGGPFGPRLGLAEGTYIAEALMPVPEVQPASVRQVIGDHGEKLAGEFVFQDDVGIIVSIEKRFEVPAINY